MLPHSVEEAVDLLISDMQPEEKETIATMNDDEFRRVLDEVAPFIIDDFKLWKGNDDLLQSCFADEYESIAEFEPATIILRRLRRKLDSVPGVVIIT